MNFSYRFRPGVFRREHADAIRGLFAPRKPRHPLLRIALGLVGVALLAVLVVVGLFVGVAMLLGSAMLRLLGMRGEPRARATTAQRVVEGEYRVVGKQVLPSGH